MSEQKVWTYKVEDIFEDIPGDNKNVNFTIPEEIREAMGVNPGDPVRILWGDQGTIQIEKITQEEYDDNTSK
jgi:bifunctional DNA-binding transcriptional regulator/antitoxin component of YhaV-PrlF toxin-antitoxin module|tara:strand:+ start:1583 stop:1798 length:216 start_codon:yes stop_codon:yes gene_type:complete